MGRALRAVVAVLTLFASSNVRAQSALGVSDTRPDRPVVTAVRIANKPVIDGRLDEGLWQEAARVAEFTQRPGRPVEGAPPSERTEVFLAYDDDRIYVGVHAYYADPGQIRASRVDRDQIQPDDK